MAWLRRERGAPSVPPAPCPSDLAAAEQAAREAEAQLAEIEARDPEVNEKSEFLTEVEKVNRLGPKFWDAMGLQRRGRGATP